MKIGTKVLVGATIVVSTLVAGLTNLVTAAVPVEWTREWLRPLLLVLSALVAAWIAIAVFRDQRAARKTAFARSARAVSAASSDSGLLDVVVATTSGAVGHASYRETGRWSAWRDLGCPVEARDIAVTSAATGRCECFVVSRSGELWHGDIGGDMRWQRLPDDHGLGPLISVAAMSGWRGHREIYVVGQRGEVAHCWRWDGKEWDRWHGAGQPAPCRDVALSVPQPGLLECFVIGRDRGVWHRWFTGEWSPWDRMDGDQPLTGRAVDALNAYERHQEIFLVTSRGRVVNRPHWQGDPWPQWREWDVPEPQTDAPGPLLDVAAGITSEGRLECLGVDEDHELWQRSYRDGGAWSSWRRVPPALVTVGL